VVVHSAAIFHPGATPKFESCVNTKRSHFLPPSKISFGPLASCTPLSLLGAQLVPLLHPEEVINITCKNAIIASKAADERQQIALSLFQLFQLLAGGNKMI
jgi:hypothetical protein